MQLSLPILCKSQKKQKTVETQTLVDSGAGGDFLHEKFVKKHQIDLHPLDQPVFPRNVDETLNAAGKMTHYALVDIVFDDRKLRTKLLVTNIGGNDLILGMPWLKECNPTIDWKTGRMELPSRTRKEQFAEAIRKTKERRKTQETLKTREEQKPLKPGIVLAMLECEEIWINAKTNVAQELAMKETEKQKPKTIEELIPPELMDYQNVFDKKEAERFPESRSWDHAIDLKPEFVPKDCKVYPLSPPEQAKMNEFIDENLAKGYIRPSKSPMASPFFFVSKKNGDLRPCQDYRRLNEGTVKNAYPLPLISELLDQLKGAKYFTKLDVRWGYNNVRIKDGDQWKAAFKTSRGLFEPTVMFFGLCNSPATFQNMMDDIFRDMKSEGWIIIYMDDIFVFTKDLQLNIHYTRKVLQRLKDNDLYLKPEKCAFWVPKVEYLGFIIQENQVAMDPVKVNGIRDWPAPTTVKQLRSFLGFGNYYRRFIFGYGDLTRPLNDLLKKDEEFTWTEERQQAFDTLKSKFTEEPVLRMPDSSKPFVLETDASLFASGAVLRQQDSNGDWHPCGYLSKSFNDTERNYDIWD